MKINLIFFLARFGVGGAGNSVYRLVTSLNKKKFKVSVICLNNCAYEKKLNKNGIKVYKLKATKLIFSFFKLKKLINFLIIDKSKNILVSNINYTNIFCSIIFWRNEKIKLIGIERTPLKELEIYFNFFDFLKKTVLKILLKISYSRFDKIVCNSEYMSKYLKKKYGFNSSTIYPPSVVKKKYKKVFLKINNKKKINIITVCRLSREKKLSELFYAINLLKDKNIKLNIVGDGPEKQRLINLVTKLRLNNQVFFLGHKSNVTSYIKNSQLYINSSYFEGFPNAVVEAVSLGIPVISSQSHGGINEILLNGKYGTIYGSGYKILATTIKNFLNNPHLFLNKAKLAKKNVLKFNLRNHEKQFQKLFVKI